MRARIIVLNYNGADILPECLPSIVEAARRATFPTGVSLLDNRSTDSSLEWVKQRFPEVDVAVALQNLLLVSFNDYVRQVDEEIVILMNNDIRVEAGFVDPLVRVFREYPDAFLAAPQCFSFNGSRYEGGRTRAQIRWGLFWSSAIFPGYEDLKEKPGYTFASGFGAFHRQRFLALGGYDDLYLPGIVEDADLGFSAWREGFRSYYVPESHVYHKGQVSFKKAFGARETLKLAHRNGFLFIWKNVSDPRLLIEHFVLLIPRFVHGVITGKVELVTGFLAALRKLPEALRRRKFPEKKSRSDRDIFSLASNHPVRRHYLFKKRWKRWAVGVFDVVGQALSRLFSFKRPWPLHLSRILVVRMDSLGDAVLSLPAIEALVRRFQGVKIDFLVSPAVRELYAYFFPSSRLHVVEKLGFKESLSLARRLTPLGYDLGVDFRGDVRSTLLMNLAGIHHRWGRGGTGGGFLLTRQIPNPYQRHEVLENLELVQENGAALRVDFPRPFVRSNGTDRVEEWLARLDGERKIVIHAGAGYPSKHWGVKRFVEVGRRIQDKGLGIPIFIGTEEEKRILEPHQNRLGPRGIDLTGKTNLEELVQLLGKVDLFIGNDSGPAHLAALMQCRIVVVFSGTNDFRHWAPWSDRLRIVCHPVPCSPCEERVCPLRRQICLEEISVEEVLRAAEEMLAS